MYVNFNKNFLIVCDFMVKPWKDQDLDQDQFLLQDQKKDQENLKYRIRHGSSSKTWKAWVINRPGVAGAVLQSPRYSLINWLTD